MRSFTCTILLLLLTLYTRAQVAHDTDRKLMAIMQVQNDTIRMDSVFHYAGTIVSEFPKEGINVANVLLQDAQNNQYKRGIANADYILGQGYEYTNNYAMGIKYYLDALGIYNELNLYRQQVNTLLCVAGVYEIMDDLGSEEKYVAAATAICEEHKNEKGLKKILPVVFDFQATIFNKEGRYDTAIKLYKQGITLARADSNTGEVKNSLCNLAIALKNNKNYNESLSTYNEVLSLTDTVNDLYPFGIIMDNMSILFYRMGDLKKSEQYALKSIDVVKGINAADLLKDTYETLKNVYTQEKRYPEALEYTEKWSYIKDTILTREKSQQITQWQTKYDTEAKDKEIADQKKQLAYNLKINLSLTVCVTLLLLLGVIIYRNYNTQKRSNTLLSIEKKRSEDLLLNILPAEVADELKNKGAADAKYFDNVTVVFTDFVNFTKASERMSPQQLIDELHYYFKAFDEITGKYDIEKIKTIGDSYLAVSGLPVPNPNHAENIVRAAMEINNIVNKRKQKMGDATFEMRIGVHSGSVVAGIVGVKKFSYDIWGDTVNTAARMEQNSEPGKINISQTTYELVKDKFNCVYRGEIEAKNKGLMKMYFIVS